MKAHLVLSLGLFLIAPFTMAQNKSDIKRIEKNQKQVDRQMTEIQDYFKQDMTKKFQCFPEYQASFEELKAKVLSSTEENHAAYDKMVNFIKEQIGPEIEELKALKLRAKKLKEPGIERIIAEKEELIIKRAETQRDHNQEKYFKTLQKIVTLEGDLDITKNIDSTDGVIKLLDSCATASCVYLIAADINLYIEHSLKLNKSLKIVDGVAIQGIKHEKLKKIEQKINETAEKLASTKPLGDFDVENCAVSKKAKSKKTDKQEDIIEIEALGKVVEMQRDNTRVIVPNTMEILENTTSEK
jgi:hypothetical protein